MSRPVIFLDRDGVINRDSTEHIKSVEEWDPIPGSLEAIGRLSRADFCIVILSNQSGLSRGLIEPRDLDAIHERLREDVKANGGQIDGIFFCPHLPARGCRCRKPAPGLIEAAERRLGIVAKGAPFVGDKISDLQAARVAGCRPIGVESGIAALELSGSEWAQVPVYKDLAAVVDDLMPSGL